MKKIFSIIAVVLVSAISFVSCSNEDSGTLCYVVDFEESSFSALIDTVQNGGRLISGDTLYAWTDKETQLTSVMAKADTSATHTGKCIWLRGCAVSNYVDADTLAGENKRLSVPSQYLSGGNNFIVVHGDSSEIYFADGKAHVIEQLALSPTTYLLNDIKKNCKENYSFTVTLTGTKSDGTTSHVDMPIAQGTAMVPGWVVYPYLAALGEVAKITFTFSGSDTDARGALRTPKYIAIDNIVVDM